MSKEFKTCQYTTKKGTMLAAVIDLQPDVCGLKFTPEILDESIKKIADAGYKRVYCVLCNPGYPMFSVPTISNYAGGFVEQSINEIGNINKAFVDAVHKHGMEAIAVYKPYEGGGQQTIPHGVTIEKTIHSEDIGGNRVFFDTFITENMEKNDLRTKRKDDGAWIIDTTKCIDRIEIAFMLDQVSSEGALRSYIVPGSEPLSAEPLKDKKFNLWISADNGRYTEYKGGMSVEITQRKQPIVAAGGYTLIPEANVGVMTISGLEIPGEYKYVAISFENARDYTTLPYSMIKIFSGDEELYCTVSKEVHRPRNINDTPENHVWGVEVLPEPSTNLEGIVVENGEIVGKTNRLANCFVDWGFEFNWHGQGHRGDGWCQGAVYGIARGKIKTFSGSLCEAYPEVREYWLDYAKEALDQGYDGIDIRLQSHSSMVLDYMNYGYNEPLVAAYKERYGKDISKGVDTEDEYIQLMKLRGEYFMLFLEELRKACDEKGKIFAMHLRDSFVNLRLDEDFNRIALWCMPKIALDWKALVDLCDEVTIKDYYYNPYKPNMSRPIREYAQSIGKPVWIHNYMSQAKNLNLDWMSAVDADPTVDGIMFYEFVPGRPAYDDQFKDVQALIDQVNAID